MRQYDALYAQKYQIEAFFTVAPSASGLCVVRYQAIADLHLGGVRFTCGSYLKNGRCKSYSAGLRQHTLNITGNQIYFQVDLAACLQVLERRDLYCMRNQVD